MRKHAPTNVTYNRDNPQREGKIQMKKHNNPKDSRPDPLVEMYRKAIPDWDAKIEEFRRAFLFGGKATSSPATPLPAWKPDLVVNAAGALLRKGQDIIRRIDQALDFPNLHPAMGTARGSDTPSQDSPPRLSRFDSHQVVDGREVIASAVLSPNPDCGVDINILLADAATGRAITPYSVAAYGPKEQLLSPPRRVDSPAQPAYFPQAGSGGYIFQIEWASGSVCHLQIEIQPDES